MKNPKQKDASVPDPEQELRDTAQNIVQVLSGDAIPRYLTALREILGAPIPAPRVISGGGTVMALQDAPEPVRQHVEEMMKHGTAGNDHQEVIEIASLLANVRGSAQQFLENRPGCGPRDTSKRLTEFGMKLLDCIRRVPNYERRAEERGERLYAEAERSKGSKLTLEEGVQLMHEDPIGLFSNVQSNIALFQVILSQSPSIDGHP